MLGNFFFGKKYSIRNSCAAAVIRVPSVARVAETLSLLVSLSVSHEKTASDDGGVLGVS